MREMIYLFDGQGAFRPGIGKELCARYPKADAMIDRSTVVLGYDLREYLWGDKAVETSSKTSVAQPAISAVSLAYAEVLREHGIEGAISLGHSLGEATAIIYCGILSFDDGMRMIKKRGEVMEEGGGKGTMMAVLNVGLADLQDMCREVTDELSEPAVVANINAPNQIVISGSQETVKKVAQRVAKKQGRSIPLNVGGAWHSPFLQNASLEFSRFLDDLQFRKPERKFYSVVEQRILDDPQDIKDALKKQMLSQVDWVAAIEGLEAKERFFLEVGPSKILRDLVVRIGSVTEVESTALHGELETLVNVLKKWRN
ncbi:MAG: ACP S-malonyltransferase [candidate division WOR-3 bacterium]|nr:MAG: ACP S-malonyltransferase [candidate division WOR-3 bacterium]